jgi:hypothetical protein
LIHAKLRGVSSSDSSWNEELRAGWMIDPFFISNILFLLFDHQVASLLTLQKATANRIEYSPEIVGGEHRVAYIVL